MSHWHKPDPVELTAIYIRTLVEYVAYGIIIAEAVLVFRLLSGGY